MPLTKHEREYVIAQGRAIIDQAEKEGRDLTVREMSEYHGTMERLGWDSLGTPMPVGGPETVGMRNAPDGWVDPQSGKEVRVFGADQAFEIDENRELVDQVRVRDIDTGRLLRGLVLGDWRGSPAEQKLVHSIDTRTMSTGSPAGGGYLVPAEISQKIYQEIRNSLALSRAGAQTVLMPAKTLDLAVISGTPTAYSVAETAAGTYSDLEFARRRLSAKKIMALVKSSRELMSDASNAGEELKRALREALKTRIDYMGLMGTGAGEEWLGVRNYPGITVTGISGALTRLENFATAYFGLLGANAPGDELAAVYNSRVARIVQTVENSTTYRQSLSTLQGEWWGKLRHVVSNQVPTVVNDTDVFMGHFPDLIVGLIGEIEIMTTHSGYSGASEELWDRDMVGFRATARGDCALIHPELFTVLSDVDVT